MLTTRLCRSVGKANGSYTGGHDLNLTVDAPKIILMFAPQIDSITMTRICFTHLKPDQKASV